VYAKRNRGIEARKDFCLAAFRAVPGTEQRVNPHFIRKTCRKGAEIQPKKAVDPGNERNAGGPDA
jgi:hypothetical protein